MGCGRSSGGWPFSNQVAVRLVGNLSLGGPTFHVVQAALQGLPADPFKVGTSGPTVKQNIKSRRKQKIGPNIFRIGAISLCVVLLSLRTSGLKKM